MVSLGSWLGQKLKPAYQTMQQEGLGGPSSPAGQGLAQPQGAITQVPYANLPGLQQLETAQTGLREAFAQQLAQQQQQALGNVQNIYAGRGTTGSGEEAFGLGQAAASFAPAAAQFEAGLASDFAKQLQSAIPLGLELQQQQEFSDIAKRAGLTSGELQLILANPESAATLGLQGRSQGGISTGGDIPAGGVGLTSQQQQDIAGARSNLESLMNLQPYTPGWNATLAEDSLNVLRNKGQSLEFLRGSPLGRLLEMGMLGGF